MSDIKRKKTIMKPITKMADIKETPKKHLALGMKPPWKPGESGNPNGRPNGSKNFSTLFNEVIKGIAKKDKVSIEKARKKLIKTAYEKARRGNFLFYKDLMDREYGKPVEPIDIRGEIEDKQILELVLTTRKILEIKPNEPEPKDISTGEESV